MKENQQSPDLSDRRKIIQNRLRALRIRPSSVKMGNDFETPEFLPIGIVQIDTILGDVPGIARGSLVEVCGEHQSGKSYICLKAIAEAQKRGLRCALLNIEQSFYEPRAAAIGVQVRNENLFEMYDEIPTAEMYGNLLETLVESGEYAVIVVDSITALIPEVDYNKDFTESPKIGAHAAFVGRLVKKLLGLCAETQTTVYLINQFRTGAGVMPGTYTKKTSGGLALEYFCHYRLWVDRVGGVNGKIIGENNEVIGGKSKVFVQKTRFGVPNQTAEFPIYFKDERVDPLGEFLYRASARGNEYITINRKVYQYIDKTTGEMYCKDKDPVEFVKKLLVSPVPFDQSQNGNFQNGFDYVSSKLRLTEEQKKDIIDSLEKEHIIDTPGDTLSIKMEEDNTSNIEEEPT